MVAKLSSLGILARKWAGQKYQHAGPCPKIKSLYGAGRTGPKSEHTGPNNTGLFCFSAYHYHIFICVIGL